MCIISELLAISTSQLVPAQSSACADIALQHFFPFIFTRPAAYSTWWVSSNRSQFYQPCPPARATRSRHFPYQGDRWQTTARTGVLRPTPVQLTSPQHFKHTHTYTHTRKHRTSSPDSRELRRLSAAIQHAPNIDWAKLSTRQQSRKRLKHVPRTISIVNLLERIALRVLFSLRIIALHLTFRPRTYGLK